MGGELGNNSQITNKGFVHVTGNDSFGMLARVNSSFEVNNFGRIEMEGTFAVGIGTGGFDHHIVNGGRINTNGDLAIGITLGVTRLGFVDAANGAIQNRGVIETNGEGAAGIIIAGDGHSLTSAGRIVTDGGSFSSDLLGDMRAAGVVVTGDDALVVNNRSGVIESNHAGSAAVELNVLERDGVSNEGTSMLKSAVIPCLRYRDAPAAMEWLVSVFGFEKNLVVPDDKGGVELPMVRAGALTFRNGGRPSVASTPSSGQPVTPCRHPAR